MARFFAPFFFRFGTAALYAVSLPLAAQPVPSTPANAAATVPAAQTTSDPTAIPARDPRGPSPDGYNWVEVEVTIFSSVYGSTPYSEIPVANSNSLRYLPQLRLLANPADAFAFPFAPDVTDETTVAVGADIGGLITAPTLPPPVLEGPVYSPAVPGAFKLLDVERDAYVALDRRFWRFNQLNSRLQSGAEHTVLWHQVWRQPLRPRAQTPALQIVGGDVYGAHNALEGSLRLSSQGQGLVADLDANLWLSSFSSQVPAATEDEWKLPDQPVLRPPVQQEPLQQQVNSVDSAVALDAAGALPAASWYPTGIWQLNQSRDVGPNALYYLDHPAMGLLIEIRPYLVPDSLVPVADTTAIPTARSFE